MRRRNATGAAVALAAAAVALALAFGGRGGSDPENPGSDEVAGRPTVEITSPRNGARQENRAVVVKVEVQNFQLAPRQFGGEPQLGQGHIRFSLKRVPDCVDPKKLKDAENSPVGKGRLVGRSFDHAEFSGPNGILAERIGTAGGYSPAARPEIYYHHLPPGFYRMVVNLAQNSGATTQFNDVTNFQILQPPGHRAKECEEGKVPAAKAAQRLE